jgi:hypothetical protein
MILTNAVLEQQKSVDSSMNDSLNEEEDKELQNIMKFKENSKYIFL